MGGIPFKCTLLGSMYRFDEGVFGSVLPRVLRFCNPIAAGVESTSLREQHAVLTFRLECSLRRSRVTQIDSIYIP